MKSGGDLKARAILGVALALLVLALACKDSRGLRGGLVNSSRIASRVGVQIPPYPDGCLLVSASTVGPADTMSIVLHLIGRESGDYELWSSRPNRAGARTIVSALSLRGLGPNDQIAMGICGIGDPPNSDIEPRLDPEIIAVVVSDDGPFLTTVRSAWRVDPDTGQLSLYDGAVWCFNDSHGD